MFPMWRKFPSYFSTEVCTSWVDEILKGYSGVGQSNESYTPALQIASSRFLESGREAEGNMLPQPIFFITWIYFVVQNVQKPQWSKKKTLRFFYLPLLTVILESLAFTLSDMRFSIAKIRIAIAKSASANDAKIKIQIYPHLSVPYPSSTFPRLILGPVRRKLVPGLS